MGLEQQSYVLGAWYYPAERTSDDRLVDLCEQTGLLIAKRMMRTLKLQLDYVLARNIPQSDIRKSRVVWDVAFDSDYRPNLLSFKIRFHKRNRGVPLQPKIDMAGLKDGECRTKFRQCVSIHVGVRTRKKFSDADSFIKSIQDAARETLPVLLPRKKFAFAFAETKSTYNSVCVARSAETRKSVLEGSCVVNCNKTAITSGRQERLKRRGRTRTHGKPKMFSCPQHCQ
ncbi:hypothetical protein RB195_023271 [Necator americanus]|uniref:Uncharacterized protein n=1 Tax=Necator americanus TaxID=51031 RepID=A0ABR1EIG7_NECAM